MWDQMLFEKRFKTRHVEHLLDSETVERHKGN